MSTDPFAALRALRDTLPEGEDVKETQEDAPVAYRATIHYERKGRGGKEATIIAGLDAMPDVELQALATRLKQRIGTGGSARCGEILLQGDRRAVLREILPSLGIKC